MLHFLPRLFLLVIFSGYDTKCALFEKASMVNCSQDFLVHEPKYWCLGWLTTSTFSSAMVISLVWIYRDRIKYSFRGSAMKLIRKASFWRMNFFLSVVFIEYTIAWQTSDKLHTILFVCSFARWFSNFHSSCYLLFELCQSKQDYYGEEHILSSRILANLADVFC